MNIYATYFSHPQRQYCTHQLANRRMVEIATAYTKWKAVYKASDPERTDPNDTWGCAMQDKFIRQAQEVAGDMYKYNLIPNEKLSDPYFDLWTFGCDLFDWWCVERHW